MKLTRVLTVIPVALLMGLGVVGTVVPEQAYAATSSVPDMIPSTGKDFWLTFMYNNQTPADDGDLNLQLTIVPKASGTISIATADGTVRLANQAVTAGVAFVYDIPMAWRGLVYNTESDKKLASGLHVYSANTDFALYMRNTKFLTNQSNSYDFSPVFPTSSLGTDYVIQTFWRDQVHTEFAIVATEDATTVKIVPSCKMHKNVSGTYPANEEISVTLNEGEVYQLKGYKYESALKQIPSGTTIGANHPVAVFNGGVKAFIPNGAGLDGDHIFEQSLPVKSWGKRFVLMEMSAFADGVTPYETYKPTEFAVTAIYPGTVVKLNGTTIATLDARETTSLQAPPLTAGWGETPKLLETSEPVIVYAYMVNAQHNQYIDPYDEYNYIAVGEPSMALVTDVNKGVYETSINCNEDVDVLGTHYVNVVVPADGVSTMLLNGSSVSSKFTTLAETFEGYPSTKKYAYARLSLPNGHLYTLSNATTPFVTVQYSVQPESAISQAAALGVNMAPTAPIVKIDEIEIVYAPGQDHAEMDYCNKHPGIKFSAEVDYPHTGVKWDLGEGATSVSMSASHMYGMTIGEQDKTHHVKFYVYHESPITHVKDTDSVYVQLKVHPVYYDTLKTKVAANKLEYIWNKSSNPAFGIAGKGELSVGPVTLGKDAPNANNKWTTTNTSKTILDSLVYQTKHDCDSIFYLQLTVVPDIIMPEETQSICQGEPFAWAGHTATAGHRLWRKVGSTWTNDPTKIFSTDQVGTFEIRDTLVSKVYPNPDSIHVLKLTVNVKPSIALTEPSAICQTDDDAVDVSYTISDATSFQYWLKDESNADAITPVTINAPFSSSFTISGLSGLAAGNYTLKATATSAAGCTCDALPVTVRIKDKPALTLKAIDAKCYPALSFDVKYTYANVTKIYYQVKNGTTPMFTDWQEVTTINGTFTISTSGWAAGTYSIEAYAEKDGCTSAHDVSKSLTITVQPTVESLNIDTVCDAEANTTVHYRTANADTCYYYIRSQGKGTLKGVKKANDAVLDFTLNVSALNTNGLVDLIDTLYFVTDASCPGDTVKVPIVLHPMPTAKITAVAPTQCFTNISGDLEIAYERSGVTNKVDWQLTKGGTVVYTKNNWTTASKLVIPAAQLTTPGNYQVKINKAYSEHCDSTGLKKGTLDFVLYDTAHITLSDISPVCEGTAVANNAYTASSIASYKYWITKAGTTVKGPFTVNPAATSGTIDMSSTATLDAGNYVLHVQATANNTCGEASVISKPFTLHAIPTIEKVEISDNSLCHKETPVPVVTVVNTTATKLTYQIFKGTTPWSPETTIDKPGDGKITGIRTDTLSPGTGYVVKVTPKSTTSPSCTGTPVSSPAFDVNALPKLTIADLAPQCYEAASFTVTYEPEGAAYVVWKVDGKFSDNWQLHNVPNFGDKKFEINTSGWAAGEYTLRAIPQSSVMCEGDTVVKTIKINTQPTVSISGVTSECKGTNPTVTLTSLNAAATHYIYWIDTDGGTQVKAFETPTAISTTFAANVSGLDPGKYKIRVQTSNGTTGCTSEVATSAAFDIHPLTTLKLNPEALDLNTIQGTASINVPYTSTEELSKYEFTFVNKTDASIHATPGTITNPGKTGSIAITTGTLPAGDYLLTVKATTKAGGCETTQTLDITIFYPTSVTITELSKIEICEGEDKIHVTIKTNYSNQYKFEVQKGGVRVYPTTEPVWTALTNVTTDGTERAEEFDLTTSSLPDGQCTLIVAVRNSSVTGSETNSDPFNFTVNPKPVIKLAKDSVCHGYNRTVTFGEGTTNVAKVTYRLEPAAIAETTVNISNNQLPLATAGLAAGSYTLYVKPISGKDCEGAEVNAPFEVNAIPTITLAAITAKPCEGDGLTAGFSHTNAHTYDYRVYNVTGGANTPTAVKGEKQEQSVNPISVDISSLAAGNYELRVVATSIHNCESKEDTAKFTIYPKPTITNVSIDSICDNKTQTELRFKVGNLTDFAGVTYTYQVVGHPTLTKTAAATADNKINITNLGDLTPGLYTINLKVNTPTCESEQATPQFRVWGLPEVSITAIDGVCYHTDETTTVTYKDTYAANAERKTTSATYTLKLGETVIQENIPVSVNTEHTFTIPTKTLEVGEYTVLLTPQSAHSCSVDPVSKTFKVNALPTLGDIKLDASAVCEGTATMGASFAHTGADSCHWELYLKGTTTPVLRQGNKNGLTDGTTNISIDLLAPTALEAGKEYDLKVIMVNTTTHCEQTKPVVTFLIRKNPSVELSSVQGDAQITMCQPVDSVAFHYKNTGATEFTYEVRREGTPTPIKSGTMTHLGTTADSIIRFGARLLQGTYTLSITPKNECAPAAPTPITFRVDTIYPKKTTATICYGESFDWVTYYDETTHTNKPITDCAGKEQPLMKGLTVSRQQFDTIFCADGCHQVYELNLNVKPKNTVAVEKHALCVNQTLTLPDGQLITKAGSYEYKTDDGAGCFIYHPVEVSQLIPELKTINQSVCFGTPVIFGGKTYAGLHVGKHELRDTISSVGGCDSVYVLMNLTVGERYYDSISITECDHYLWHGKTYTKSGIYREELSSVDGCDSVAVLNLTIHPKYDFYESYDILDTQLPFTVHEDTYESAGTYEHKFTTVAGCDSTYHITLTTHTEPLPKDTTVHTMCEGAPFSWQGADYTKDGWYSVTEKDAQNKEVAIHVLHLIVHPKYTNTTYVHHCGDNYLWPVDGQTYSTSGTYSKTFQDVNHCDSTEILVLTLGKANSRMVEITACRYEPVNVGSKTFLASEASYADIIETFTNASGCDSTVTYKITVIDRENDKGSRTNHAFCEGKDSYNWHETDYTVAGTYYDTTYNGTCIRWIDTLVLTAKAQYHFDEDVEVWEDALPYVWVGHKCTGLTDTLLRTDGDYYDRLTASSGCDSIHHIHFHVNWYTRDTTNTEANPDLGCGSVTWKGKTYTESCLASDTAGNTIEYRYIVVTNQYSVEEPEFTICTNTPFKWHGDRAGYPTKGDKTLTYTVPQKYKGKIVEGCDSIYTVTIHVVETFSDEQTVELCPDKLPYLWRGKWLTKADDYTDVVPSPTGCDSTFTLHLKVNESMVGPKEKSDKECQGHTYEWYEGTTKIMDIPANEPGEFTYYHWYKPATGCPDYKTYYKLNLTVGKNYNEDPELHLDSTLTKHICQGTGFEWFGDTRKVEGADVVELNDHMFMKVFHYEEPSVAGCDSLVADLTLVAHKKYEKKLQDTTICNFYNWDGENVTTEGDEITYKRTYHLYPELGECGDSILTRKFTVLHSEVQTIDKDTCDFYFWDKTGERYTESGTYTKSIKQLGGLCDKIYTLNLTIRKKGVKDIDKQACYSYVWAAADGGDGRLCEQDGTYEYKLDIPSVSGCDSIHYLHLTLNDSVVKWLDPVEACDSYEWKGTIYTDSRTLREVGTGSNGCDSITNLKLTIKHSSPVTNIEETACRRYDDSEHGIHLDESNAGVNNFSFTYTNAEGCDSVVNIKVTITTPDTVEHTFKACDSFTWNGETYTEIGTYDKYQDFVEHDDCALDSVILLHLTIGANVTKEITLAEWSPYIWEGDTYTESGTYTKTLEAACGCDSTVILHLTVNDPESDEETQFACQTYTWPWAKGAGAAQSTYTESGDYEVKWTNHPDVGHDSIRILHLTIKEPEKIVTTVKECDSYTWEARGFKQTYTESGKYENIYNDGVCDNIDSLYLTISHTPLPVVFNDTACDVLTVNGKSYFNSIDFTDNLKTVADCDSVVNYHLKINHRKVQTISEDACGSYLWEATGETYTQSGSYTQVLETADGCDSVVTLNLSIHRPYTYDFTACGKFEADGVARYRWDGRIYTEAGDHSYTYQSVRGCDSVVTLHLSMPVDGIDKPEQVTACDEYLWHGRLLKASGSYNDTIKSLVNGCDSVAWLFLVIDEHPTSEESYTAQTSSYTWGNKTYYEPGDYERRFPLEDGRCDSIVTLHLDFANPLPVSTEFSATACDAYTWDSETFYESGVYVRNFPTLDGRDSIVKLTLTINHDTTVYRTDKLCGPYEWHGRTLTETGTYTQVLQRASGCDSVVTLTLTLCERFETSFVVEARDVYTWDGQTYTESTTETRQYASHQGCDSLVTMVLTIIKTANTVDNAEACTEYAWADSIFTESTIHSHVFPASTGGDSVVTMTLIIHEPVYTDLADTVREPQCSTPGYEYELPWGETVKHTGIYTYTTESKVTGCDSIVRFHLQWCDEELCIDTLPVIAVEQCGPYTWDKTGEEYSVTGTYDYHERDALTGCEHVSLLRLNILPEVYHTIDTTACESLKWDLTGETYTESGSYRYVYENGAANGCDSTVILRAVIGHAGEETIEVSSCDAYTINGETFNESGEYVQHLTTVTGCDSTLTIVLTLSSSKESTDNGTTCDDTVWNNVTLTETGFYPQVLQSAEGCDSVVTLHLIVYESKQIEYIDSTHCDSILWGPDRDGKDTLIFDDGIYERTFLSSVGCDSTVTMDLRLKHKEIVLAPDTQACDSFVWNNKVYFESDTYSDTTVSTRTGCDSITTMHIEINPTIRIEIHDTVPPPFHLWPTENDTIWKSGDYVDTVPSFITGCDSITTLHLVITDSIILDSLQPVRIDTLGYCPGDTVHLHYNLLKGHPTRYILIFDTVAPRVPDYTRDFMSVLDTTDLPNHGIDSIFTLVIPEFCPPGKYEFDLQMFDDYSSSEIYHYYLLVAVKGEIVSLWTDVVAIDNHEEKYIGYQWYIKRDPDAEQFELIPGATKQYYSDNEDLNACYRAKVQLASDSSWIYTCEECFDLRTDSLELIAYPTPAPVGQPVTIKALGILLEKLPGSLLTITNVQGVTLEEHTFGEGQRSVDVKLGAGLYIAVINTPDGRTANVKFTIF